MLDVMLINPPYSFTDLVKLKRKRRSRGFYLNYPHLGLLYLASSLKKAGFSVEVLDASAQALTEGEIIRKIIERQPEVIGITVTTQTSRGVFSLIKKIKKIKDSPEIVIGGPQVSALPETVRWMQVGYGMVGEGELAFVKLINYLIRNKGELKKIPGLIFLQKGKLISNINRPNLELDKLPFPARELVSADNYFSPVYGGRMTTLITSRGCPYNCTYCSRPAIGYLWRKRKPSSIVAEMKEVVDKYQVGYIEFVDDTFTIDKARIMKLCQSIIKNKVQVTWGGQTRADLVDYALLKKMKAAGCVKLSFGLETGVERIRFDLNKRVPDRAYAQAVENCRKLGIETNLFVMFGHPGEKLEDMQESISLTRRLDPDYAAFYITTILPGSVLGAQSARERRIKPSVWQDYMEGKGKLPAYVPSGITRQKMEEVHKSAYSKFYFRPQYIFRRIKKINNWRYVLNTLKSGWTILTDYISPVDL